MPPLQRFENCVAAFRAAPLLPKAVFIGGLSVCILALSQLLYTLQTNGHVTDAVFDFVLFSIAGGAFAYVGIWMGRAEITRQHYARIISWAFGGIIVMFVFILLRELHPGVTAEWTTGTQVIALTLGSIGGLSIGIQETKAKRRTEQLDDRSRELEASKRRLEEHNKQLEEFANVVSHDLRNPLAIAEGRLELAKDECDSTHLDGVETAHERMRDLIEDLLTLARQQEASLEFEPVPLPEFVEQCWGNVDTVNATLVTRLDASVEADRSRLKQLFENLFRNAVEHGGENVAITVGELEDGFYIEDTGSGIPEKEHEEIFETGYTTVQDGTGFGLSIVAEIVDAHGWTITTTDGESGGARFEITDVERTSVSEA